MAVKKLKPDFALTQGWWYPALLASLLILFILFMKKRNLRWREIALAFCIIGYVVWMTDMTLAVPFDIFDIGHPDKEGLPELLLYGVIPSCFSVIYLNFFNKEKRWLLAALFVGISWLSEWLSIQVGLVEYKKWNTWYSLPVHIAAYAFFLPWLLKFIKKTNPRQP